MKAKMKIGICGATGYSGRELIKILLRHPHAEIVFLTSEQFTGQSIAEVFPEFRSRIEMKCQKLETFPNDAQKADIVFLGLPHTVSMKMAKLFLAKGTKVIDLSGDFRLPADVYEKWYKHPHEDAENLSRAVYGLTEIFRKDIKNANLISNPGCYPTASTLGLIPAVAGDWIDLSTIVIDAKSGVSGAGRSPSLSTHFSEVYENMKAYKIAVHQHTPEIENVIGRIAGKEIQVVFVPHLIPIDKGILSTIYARLKRNAKTADVLKSYQEFYKNEAFVRVLPQGSYPLTKSVEGTNYCDMGLEVDERTGNVIIISVIDNMVKGASGQAVQNMNVMCGFPETEALV